MKKYSDKEDKLIMFYAEKYGNNIRQGFEVLSKEINRTPSAIVTRYYNKLQPNIKDNTVNLGVKVLSEKYIIHLLIKSGIQKADITPEIIELKRTLLSLTRTINEKSK